jgi:hypothetical protein
MRPESELPEMGPEVGPEIRAEFPDYKQIQVQTKWHLSFPFVFVYIWG